MEIYSELLIIVGILVYFSVYRLVEKRELNLVYSVLSGVVLGILTHCAIYLEGYLGFVDSVYKLNSWLWACFWVLFSSLVLCFPYFKRKNTF